jgi:ElaB/YqjD/DUF883 family membrane-anchored ribosome-binding protein
MEMDERTEPDRNTSGGPPPELDVLRRRLHDLGAELERADERGRQLIRHRPFLALAVAAGVGYVAGRLLLRRT